MQKKRMSILFIVKFKTALKKWKKRFRCGKIAMPAKNKTNLGLAKNNVGAIDMKIVLAGCGKIGKTIISSLIKEKHDVTAIDVNPKVVDDTVNAYDVMAIVGSATEYSILKEAGVQKADLFIAVTGSDELNMLGCLAAKKLGASYTVARIRNLENNDESLEFMQKNLDLDMAINPELMAAQAIYNVIKLPSATKVEMFSSRHLKMLELILPEKSALDGITLKEIRKNRKERFLICTIGRNNEIFIPNGDFVIRSGDKIGLIVSETDIHKVLALLGIQDKAVSGVMIIGAGIISRYLSKMLSIDHIPVKIIENDDKLCDLIGEGLTSNVTLVNGDGMSQDLLLEEGILSSDAFIALTGKDELNILISFYAMSQKVGKVIGKVNSNEFSSLAEKLGLTGIITPKKIVADAMVKYARALQSSLGCQIETLYSLMNGMAEAAEFKVLSDFEHLNIPLKTLNIKKNYIIAGIIRNRKAIIPSGEDVFLNGDHVIVIAKGKHIYALSDIVAE